MRELCPSALCLRIFECCATGFIRFPKANQHILAFRAAVKNVAAVAAIGQHRRQFTDRGERLLLQAWEGSEHRDGENFMIHTSKARVISANSSCFDFLRPNSACA